MNVVLHTTDIAMRRASWRIAVVGGSAFVFKPWAALLNPTNMEEKMHKGTLTLTWFFMAKPGREAVAAGTTMQKMLKVYADPMAEWSPTAEVDRTEVEDIGDIITEDVDVASPVYFEGEEALSIYEAYAAQFGRTIEEDFGK